MNPEQNPIPQINPEYRPQAPQEIGEQHIPGHENIGEQLHEREQNMQQVDRQNTPPPPPPMPLPPAPVTLPAPQQQATDDASGPTIANDDDLIEKEWVDKAKKIITETQNDPYRREKEVSKLQIDYLRKRYGKELGTSN